VKLLVNYMFNECKFFNEQNIVHLLFFFDGTLGKEAGAEACRKRALGGNTFHILALHLSSKSASPTLHLIVKFSNSFLPLISVQPRFSIRQGPMISFFMYMSPEHTSFMIYNFSYICS